MVVTKTTQEIVVFDKSCFSEPSVFFVLVRSFTSIYAVDLLLRNLTTRKGKGD